MMADIPWLIVMVLGLLVVWGLRNLYLCHQAIKDLKWMADDDPELFRNFMNANSQSQRTKLLRDKITELKNG